MTTELTTGLTTGLTIGRLAGKAGVNVETIRYYQRRGLMATPDKPAGGQRRYDSDAIRRVRFIKRAQVLGFTLEDVGSLLALDEAHACADTRQLAAHKLQRIDEKLADLKAMRKALTALVRQCEAGATQAGCPIIRALAADGSPVPLGSANAPLCPVGARMPAPIITPVSVATASNTERLPLSQDVFSIAGRLAPAA